MCVRFTDLFLNFFFPEQTVVVVLAFLVGFFFCIFPLNLKQSNNNQTQTKTIARDAAVEKHLNVGIELTVVFHGDSYAVCNLISKNNFKKN